jgi:uncharacterized protein
MILELDKLSDDPERITADEVVSFEDVDGNENQIDCHIELNVRKVAESFFIQATLEGRFSTPCHACLEPTECHVNSSFDLVVKKASTDSKGATPDDGNGDDALIYLPAGENELTLDQLIYENLVSDIPIQIRCRENCRGLCSGCGVKLNDGACECAPETDPRWDALKSLRQPEEPSSE